MVKFELLFHHLMRLLQQHSKPEGSQSHLVIYVTVARVRYSRQYRFFLLLLFFNFKTAIVKGPHEAKQSWTISTANPSNPQ